MLIGITYDLRAEYLAEGYGEEETAEFDRPDTIDAIDSTLQELGHTTDRIGNLKKLVSRLAAGARWDLVFNIAEGLYGIGREAQVPALLEAYRIPYTFSDSMIMALTLHKGMTKHIIRDLRIPTPDFQVITSAEAARFIRLPLPLFAKPVAEGTGKGVNPTSKITSYEQLEPLCVRLLATYKQPVIVETFLPGREFTVGIVGTGDKARAIGVIEIILLENSDPDVYSYRNKEICEEVVEYRLVDDELARQSAEVALAAWRGLGCRDAGRIDLRTDAQGVPNFIEVNPLAGIHPEHSDLPIIANKIGLPYRDLIAAIIDSAAARCVLQ
jgi:D-alanine-D-alanine ligase